LAHEPEVLVDKSRPLRRLTLARPIVMAKLLTRRPATWIANQLARADIENGDGIVRRSG
jgi:hypothetical protein